MASTEPAALPMWQVNLLALACATLITNIYFVQPIADLVATDIGIPR